MAILSFYEGVNPSAGIASGAPTFFIEEERLNRVKHSDWKFPIKAILACLSAASVEVHDLEAIVYPWDSPMYGDGRLATFYDQVNRQYGTDEATQRWQRANIARFEPHAVQRRLKDELLRETGVRLDSRIRFSYVPHHVAHAFTAIAGIEHSRALVLAVDGSGETLCTSVWLWEAPDLRLIWGRNIPHSLGWFYAAITELVGFDAYDGEYKVMGLAGLGEPSSSMLERMHRILWPGDDKISYILDRSFIHNGPHSFSSRFTDKFPSLLGISPRPRNGEMRDIYIDIAAAAQVTLERILVGICKHFTALHKPDIVCLSGGVAMNVKANGEVLTETGVKSIWIPPYPNDAGTPLGAIASYCAANSRPMPDLSEVYLGPDYDERLIEKQLVTARLPYTRPLDITYETARRLAYGNVVAWFQGRSEAGQRALGNRSIVGDPRSMNVADRINNVVKRRERWRPLCPVLLEEACSRYLDDARISPHMMVAVNANAAGKAEIPAVIHADGTVRAQLLRPSDNPLFWRLVSAFKQITGVGALINTSLNRAGQPMVETAQEALELFGSSAIDVLVIGPFLLEKTNSTASYGS
jgi:carbamoyltransferase